MSNHNPNSDNTTPSSGKQSGAARTLSPEHRRALEEESAIAPQVVSSRGYFTATDPAELRELGSPRCASTASALTTPARTERNRAGASSMSSRQTEELP